MRRHLSIGLLLAGATLFGCSEPTPVEEIARLEDSRTLGGDRLLRQLENPSAGMRARAVRAAGRIADPRAVPALGERLQDPDPVVVQEAAFALGQIALLNPETSPVVVELLVTRPLTMGVRRVKIAREVAAALGKTEGATAERALVRMLTSRFPSVRGEAALSFRRLGALAPLNLILPMTVDSVPDVRWKAVLAIAPDPSTEALDALRRALDDPEEMVRQVTCRALRESPHEAAADLIVDHLERGEWVPSVQTAAVVSLGELGRPRSLPTLRKFMHAVWPQVRIAAAAALADMGETTPLADFVSLAETRNAFVRAHATRGLGHHQSEAVEERLLALFADSARVVRREAARSLAARRPDLRRTLLTHDDPWVRAAAAAEAEPEEVDVFRTALRDSDPFVVVTALGALRGIVDSHTTLTTQPALFGEATPAEWLAEHYRPGARVVVKRALLETLRGMDPPCEQLLSAVRDADHRVRTAARELLADGPCDLPDAERIRSLGWPEPRPTDYPNLDRLPRRAEIVTEHGSVVIRLRGRHAPRTVANFVRLAKSGFYDGTRFTDLSPDSLLTAGCRRGDAHSDPGFTIRCEINPLRIERGAVAMRAMGPDDGHAVFVVALSPQPSLDGHFTVFGSVIHGMKMLDALTAESRIEKVIIG